MIFPDELINKLFEGANFGTPINESVSKKRKFIAKTLWNQLAGFWSCSTAYNIVVDAGFLKDAKSSESKKLTKLGVEFLDEYARLKINGDMGE